MRTLDVHEAEHGEQRERGHLDEQEGAGDPGVRADVEARRDGGEHDHDERGRERVEAGDRDAEVVGDAEREDRDDQRQARRGR